MENIFLQKQIIDIKDTQPSNKLFALKWVLKCKNGKSICSEWTPCLEPSITKTLKSEQEIVLLEIIGKDLFGGYELCMARIPYVVLKGFGYIAEQSFGAKGIQEIVGIWIEVNGNKIIKIFRNGKIKEILK